MEAPALLNPLDLRAAQLREWAAAAAVSAGLLAAGEPIPGDIRLHTEREPVDFALSCAFSLAKRAGIAPRTAAEQLISAPEAAPVQRIWAENGYVNCAIPEETLLQALAYLCALPMPEPSAAGYAISEEERLRRDRGCPLYAVTSLEDRLRVLTDRYGAEKMPAGTMSGAERRLTKRLCRASDMLSEREGAALLGLLDTLAGELRGYLDTGPLLHGEASEIPGRVLLLRAAERVLLRGIRRMNFINM